jgi:cell wall-associated NlpC family hydrolase
MLLTFGVSLLQVTPAAAAEEDESCLVFAQCKEYINIRSEADLDSEVVAKIYNHGAAEVLDEKDGWYEIKSGNATGYVDARYFATGEEAEKIAEMVAYQVAVVYPEYLNIRSDSDLASEVIDTARQDQELEVVDTLDDGWTKVALPDDVYGYVDTRYVEYKTYYPTAKTLEEEEAEARAAEEAAQAAQEDEEASAYSEYEGQTADEEEDSWTAETAGGESVEDTYVEDSTDTETDSTVSDSAYTEESTEADSTYTEESTATDSAYTEESTASDSAYTEECTAADSAYTEESTAADSTYTEESTATDSAYTEESTASDSAYTEESTATDSDYTEASTASDSAYTEESTASDSTYTEESTATDSDYTEESTATDSDYTEESTDTEDTSVAATSTTGQQIVDYALQFVGNPYVWGGTSLTNGADCSGFTQSVFANFGISLSRTAAEQAGGTSVAISDIQPGDLLFYSEGSGISHVAIYMGNGQIVHAANANSGITISNYDYSTPVCACRYW